MLANKILLLRITLLLLMTSCIKSPENKERQVTCNSFSDYNEWYAWTSGPMCKSDTCTSYQAIWKELFLERNHLTEDFFNRHIIPCSSGVGTWNEGTSFSICYKIKIDWATVYRCDQFIIKIKKDNIMFSNLKIPTDVLLSKDNIRVTLDHHAFGSGMTHLSNDQSLMFNSNKSALDRLIRDSKLNTLCFRDVVLNESGHMMLEAFAQYIDEENSCVEGLIDLVNGETKVNDMPCYITAN